MTQWCVHVMLIACKANIYVCRESRVRPVQEPSPRSMYSDAAGDFGTEPSVGVTSARIHAAARTHAAGGLRLFGSWAVNDMRIFLHVSSVHEWNLL